MARLLTLAGVAILALWGANVGLLWAYQERFIFFPDTSPLAAPPIAGAFRLEEVETADALRLRFWAAPPQPGKPTIILFHGNAGKASDNSEMVARVVDAGYGLVLAEYRGYGGNPGTPSEAGFYQDAQAYLDWVAEKWSVHAPIIWGMSLGTGVATWVAMSSPVAGVVLDAPFTSMIAVAQDKYPWVPVRALLRHPFDSLSRMKRIVVPILICHGEADTTIPVEEGRRMLAAAVGPARGIFLPGIGHTALSLDPSGHAMDALLEFLAGIATKA
jgi:fermentation-respiration switch protein FrsA (DUF1100 family)